ncbi:unnamed protein product [Moneuplotes crassus]|uniref:Uncharacterized protein n=1 Tax=Euplotes crassus TaxID=5936 RepID=A0AAD1XS36_EUPCR|nr:unnamed protein product [Moneuplotes crassus]
MKLQMHCLNDFFDFLSLCYFFGALHLIERQAVFQKKISQIINTNDPENFTAVCSSTFLLEEKILVLEKGFASMLTCLICLSQLRL